MGSGVDGVGVRVVVIGGLTFFIRIMSYAHILTTHLHLPHLSL